MRYTLVEDMYNDQELRMLVPSEEISQVYYFGDDCVYKVKSPCDLTPDELKALRDEYDIMSALSLRFPEVESVTEYDFKNDGWCYIFPYEGKGACYPATDLETSGLYQWWDGANWRNVWIYEGISSYEIETSDDEFTLDTWDGYNWCTGGTFNHERLVKIGVFDGEPVEDQWLHIVESDYEDQHTRGEVLTQLEAEEYVSHLPNKEEVLSNIRK